MAGKKKRNVSPLPQPIVLTGNEKMLPMDVLKTSDSWSEYTLNDGAIIRVKPVVVQIKKIVGKFHLNGDPVYMVQAGVAVDTVIPPKLKKKGK